MTGRRILVARQDSMGDVLLAGPAIRSVAAAADEVVLLAGPRGRAAADLLPGVSRVIEWCSPWIDPEPPPASAAHMHTLIAAVAGAGADAAIILTSFHQSPLPLALLLRMAGVPWIGAISADYPGSLLDLRHRVDEDIPEAERMLSLATAAGFPPAAGDDLHLRVRRPLPGTAPLTGPPGYLVLHPGTAVPARAWPAGHFAAAAGELTRRGWRVVVTGSPAERPLTRYVTNGAGGGAVTDLGGRTGLAELAGVLAGAAAVIAGNTGPAHLAAAVGTPVVSLFAPTVPAKRWAPYGVPVALLGDQDAPCRDTRATRCPVPGHPCLASVTPGEVTAAAGSLAGKPEAGP